MSKLLKKMIVSELEEKFKERDSFVVVNYKGIDSEQHVDLRKTLFENDCNMQVIKNSLAKLAFKNLGCEELNELIQETSAVVVSNADEVRAAKTVSDWIKKNKIMEIRGGYISGTVLSPEKVKEIASLPDREQLLGQVAGAAVGPLSATVSIVSNLIGNVVGCVENLREKREKEEQE